MDRFNWKSVLFWAGIYAAILIGMALVELGSLKLWMILALAGFSVMSAATVELALEFFGMRATEEDSE